MSIKSALVGLALIGATGATLFYYKDSIKTAVDQFLGGLGHTIKCGVDFGGFFEDCKQGNAPGVGDTAKVGEKVKLGNNECVYQGNSAYSCEDALGKFVIKNPGTPQATINDKSISEYSLSAIEGLPPGNYATLSPEAKSAYASLVEGLTLEDQTKLLGKDLAPGGKGYESSIGVFDVFPNSTKDLIQPLTQEAYLYYCNLGTCPRKVA